jgi:galactokinase
MADVPLGLRHKLQAAFASQFGSPSATHLVRAPGRVNLIGDHTDYNGLPVFPMAIQREIQILLRPRSDDTVRVANVDPEFSAREFRLSRAIDPYPPGDWGNYLKSAGQALSGRLRSPLGFDGVVASDVPVAAGLSSSSALVIASALAIQQSSGASLEVLELAALMAAGERCVGTRGGGMDQAICLAAEEGSAIRMDFDPLRLTPVAVPQGWQFIVAYSLERAAKAASARQLYNQRVRECRLASETLADHLGVLPGPRLYPRLLIHTSEEDLLSAAGQALTGDLHRRLRHVITESCRVDQAQRAMAAADIVAFGGLMLESHSSLRDDYEVSCEPLDRLVEISTTAGARGARLTGAGLGGCIIALTEDETVNGVVEALAREFYASRSFDGQLEDQLFVAHPSGGASVWSVH